jgi:hypothetical protein
LPAIPSLAQQSPVSKYTPRTYLVIRMDAL